MRINFTNIKDSISESLEAVLLVAISALALVYVFGNGTVLADVSYWYGKVGIALPVFFVFAVILIASVIQRIVQGKIEGWLKKEITYISEDAQLYGLLGSVLGMMYAFDLLGNSIDDPMLKNMLVALGYALITTALGVLMTLISKNIKRRWIDPKKKSEDVSSLKSTTRERSGGQVTCHEHHVIPIQPCTTAVSQPRPSLLNAVLNRHSAVSPLLVEKGVPANTNKMGAIKPETFLESSNAVPSEEEDENAVENLKEEREQLNSNFREAFRCYGLDNFEIEASRTGPGIHSFSVKVPEGARLNALENILRDIARQIGVSNIRIDEVAEPSTIILEVPRLSREFIRLHDAVMMVKDNPAYAEPMAFLVGMDQKGEAVITDLREMPHLLIAGSTQAGKGTLIDCLIAGMTMKSCPETLCFALIDLKAVTLSKHKGLPHLLWPVATNIVDAEKILKELVAVMESRYELLSKNDFASITEFNTHAGQKMPYIVVVIDEYGSFSIKGDKDNASLILLASKGAAAGIHLVLATQRIDHRVVDKRIQMNIPGRIALKVSDSRESRLILDRPGAEKLLGKEDMLLKTPSGELRHIQGCYIDRHIGRC